MSKPPIVVVEHALVFDEVGAGELRSAHCSCGFWEAARPMLERPLRWMFVAHLRHHPEHSFCTITETEVEIDVFEGTKKTLYRAQCQCGWSASQMRPNESDASLDWIRSHYEPGQFELAESLMAQDGG